MLSSRKFEVRDGNSEVHMFTVRTWSSQQLVAGEVDGDVSFHML